MHTRDNGDSVTDRTFPAIDHKNPNELDQWIKHGLDAQLSWMDAVFDFDAGLADVYAQLLRQLADTARARRVATEAVQLDFYRALIAASDAGWSLEAIGRTIGLNRQTVRHHLSMAYRTIHGKNTQHEENH